MANEIVVFDSLSYAGDCRALAAGFRDLPKALAKKHIKAAMNRAVKPFLPALRAATPRFKGKRFKTAAVARDSRGRYLAGSGKKSTIKPGALRRSIRSITKFTNKVNHGSFYTKVGFARGEGKGNHALWIEQGTGKRKVKATGANRGAVSPRWFLRTTFNAMAPGIQSSIGLHLSAALEVAGRELPRYLANRRR
jgi:hypothetical protein